MADTNNNKVMAVLCYLGILWIIPLLTEHKNDPFLRFHINQGIILSIFWVVVRVASWILSFIPILGPIVSLVAWVAIVVLMILGIMNAVNMDEKPLPIIGTLFTVYK